MPDEKHVPIPIDDYRRILDARFRDEIWARLRARILGPLSFIGAPSIVGIGLLLYNYVTGIPDDISRKLNESLPPKVEAQVLAAVRRDLPADIDKAITAAAADSRAIRTAAEQAAQEGAHRTIASALTDPDSNLSRALQRAMLQSLGQEWRSIERAFHEVALDRPHDPEADPGGEAKLFAFQRLLQIDPERAVIRLSDLLKAQVIGGDRPEPFLDDALAVLTGRQRNPTAPRLAPAAWRSVAEPAIRAANLQRGGRPVLRPATVSAFIATTADDEAVAWLRDSGPAVFAGQPSGGLAVLLLGVPRADARLAALSVASTGPGALRGMLAGLAGGASTPAVEMRLADLRAALLGAVRAGPFAASDLADLLPQHLFDGPRRDQRTAIWIAQRRRWPGLADAAAAGNDGPAFRRAIEQATVRAGGQVPPLAPLLQPAATAQQSPEARRGDGARLLAGLLPLPQDDASTWVAELLDKQAVPEARDRALLALLASVRLLARDTADERGPAMTALIDVLAPLAAGHGEPAKLAAAALTIVLGSGDPGAVDWAVHATHALAAAGKAPAGPAALAMHIAGARAGAAAPLIGAIAAASLDEAAPRERERWPLLLAAGFVESRQVPTQSRSPAAARPPAELLGQWAAAHADPAVPIDLAALLLAVRAGDAEPRIDADLLARIAPALTCPASVPPPLAAARARFLRAAGEPDPDAARLTDLTELPGFVAATDGTRALRGRAVRIGRSEWALAQADTRQDARLVLRLASDVAGTDTARVALVDPTSCWSETLTLSTAHAASVPTPDAGGAILLVARRAVLGAVAATDLPVQRVALGGRDLPGGVPVIGAGYHEVALTDPRASLREGGFLQIAAQAGKRYRISTRDLPDAVETELAVYDARGRAVLARGEGTRDGRGSRIVHDVTEAAPLLLNVRMRGAADRPRGGVLLVVQVDDVPAPLVLQPGVPQVLTFVDNAMLHATLAIPEAGTWRISTHDLADDVDTVVAVHRDGQLLAEDDDSGGDLASRVERELTPGRYAVSIRNLGDAEGPLARFTLRVDRVP
jgi:hypothetical protein